MEELTKAIDKKRAILSLIIGLLLSLGSTMSLKTELDLEDPLYETMSERMIELRTLYLSFSSDKFMTLILAIGFAALFYLASRVSLKWIQKIIFFVISACFSIWQLIAYTFKNNDNWDLIIGYPLNEQRATLRGIAITVVCYLVLALLYELFSNHLSQKIRDCKRPDAMMVFVFAALMVIAWLPYFMYYYPGTCNEDTIIQMMEHFGIRSYINDMSPVLSETGLYTNHHPYILTVLFGFFFDLGIRLGDLRLGIAIYTVLHMIFIAVTFSICLNYALHVGVESKRVYLLQAFFMIFPIFPMYAICMVKDTLYTAFVLYMILMMWEVSRTKGDILGKWWFDLLLFADALLMMLTKVYGMYIMILVLVYYLIRYWRKCLHILVAIAVPIFLFKCVYTDYLLPSWGVAPGGIQEALSVPFQQTARYIKEYGDEVTDEEKEAIDAILPYKKLAKKYEPKLSDPIKKLYNQEATDEDLKAYLKVWWQMFKKHKGVYLEATLANTYEYFEFNKVSSLVYYEWDPYLQEYDAQNIKAARKAAKKAGEDPKAAAALVETHEDLYVLHDENTTETRFFVDQLILFLQKVPFLNFFASIGLLPWTLAFFAAYLIGKKRYRYLEALLIPALTVCICLLSPDNGNYRYILPLVWSYPILLAMLLVPEKDGKDAGQPVEKVTEAVETTQLN